MTTLFKRIRENTVMCTVQGCSQVAAFFYAAGTGSDSNPRPVAAAYCETHAEDAAKRLGHSWPVAERKPAEKAIRDFKYVAGAE